MINLNNINKLLILLILSSCTVTTSDVKKDKKKILSTKDESYFQKSNINISPLEDYETELFVSEKFYVDENIIGNQVSHISLPFPSVVKISDPANLKNYLIARNVRSNNNSRFSISSEIFDKLQAKTNIYIEYLKEESIILRKVEDSKEESKIKMDSTIISAETLDDDQSGISSKLDYSKIKNLEAKIDKYRNLLLIDKFNDLNSAKLQTNKIKNLGLIIEEIENKIFVFAGPFNDNNINLKLDFLIKNGYMNAKIYP